MTKVRISVLLAVLVLAAACGGAASSSTGDVLRDLAARPGLSEFQRQLLEDGELTFSEYERAVRGFVSCLEAQGYEANHVEIDEDAGFTITVAWPEGIDPATSEAERDGCEEEYISAVELAFATTRENEALD